MVSCVPWKKVTREEKKPAIVGMLVFVTRCSENTSHEPLSWTGCTLHSLQLEMQLPKHEFMRGHQACEIGGYEAG